MKAGYTQNTYEPGLYTLIRDGVEAYVIVYVYDILMATNCEEQRKRAEMDLQEQYKVKILGDVEIHT